MWSRRDVANALMLVLLLASAVVFYAEGWVR